MLRKSPSLWALGTLLALGASIGARTSPAADEFGAPPAAASLDGSVLLLDLDDDVAGDELARVGRRVSEAIAPEPWPADASALGRELVRGSHLYRLNVPPSEVSDVLRTLRADDAVEALEVEGAWSLPISEQLTARDAGPLRDAAVREEGQRTGEFTPNDPYFEHQWHLDQIGMRAAWPASRGDGAVVAVVDTGVSHRREGGLAPDLAGTRFVAGYDFVDRDDGPDDEHGHGTHVAGTVAQTTDNGIGVAGVAPAAAIMPVRVLDARGAGRYGDVAAGIRWAADHGANIINLSLGGSRPSEVVAAAIAHAHARGVVVVAAAGNAGRANVEYPAAYPGVLAVGAVRYDATLAFYSNYGVGLDLVAPGGDLRVDQNRDGLPDGVLQNTRLRSNAAFDYIALQGTSMAAPHVAGVAALLYGAGLRTAGAIERVMLASTRDLNDARRYSAGLLRADAALTRAAVEGAPVRGLFALLLALAAFASRGRRRWEFSRAELLVAVGAMGGLAALAILGASTSVAAHASFPAVVLGVIGSDDALATVIASALVPVAVIAVRPSYRWAHLCVTAMCFAWAGHLLGEALYPRIATLVPRLVEGPWLIMHAALCAWLGSTIARRA